jgi:hypothetical protein
LVGSGQFLERENRDRRPRGKADQRNWSARIFILIAADQRGELSSFAALVVDRGGFIGREPEAPVPRKRIHITREAALRQTLPDASGPRAEGMAATGTIEVKNLSVPV